MACKRNPIGLWFMLNCSFVTFLQSACLHKHFSTDASAPTLLRCGVYYNKPGLWHSALATFLLNKFTSNSYCFLFLFLSDAWILCCYSVWCWCFIKSTYIYIFHIIKVTAWDDDDDSSEIETWERKKKRDSNCKQRNH